MYKNADKMASGLVNLFFFECKKEYTGSVWMQEPGYVTPWVGDAASTLTHDFF